MNGTPEGACVVNAVLEQSFPKSQVGIRKTWTLPLI